MMLCFPHSPCLAALVTTGVLFVFNLAVVGSTHADEPLPGGHYRLLAVKVVPIERTQKAGVANDHESDRLTHWVRFDIHPKFELSKGTKDLPFKLLNPAITAKSELTFDKPIRFKGMELPAGFNLLKHQKFDGSFFNVSMPDPTVFAIHSVRIHSDFVIPADTYTVSFKWKTKEGTVFSDRVKVRIDVPSLRPKP